MPRIKWNDLARFGVQLLTKKGMRETDARYVADVAVTSQALGISTHGVVYFAFFDAVTKTTLKPAAQPKVVKDKGATALIDGNAGAGQLSMKLATEIAIEKAKELGVAMVGVRNAHWIAALAPYMMPIAEEKLLGQLWVQATTCKDSAPVGGIDARFSTNPISITFPTPDGAMIADFSTSAVSMGKANRMIREGMKADGPIFMDRQGDLTDDPAVMKDDGTILFTGGPGQGHKGYALSLWCEALTAMVGGMCNNPQGEQRQVFSLLVIDPQAFAGADVYMKEMKRFIAHVRSSRLRPGFTEIRLPGERALRELDESKTKGVPVDDGLLRKLNEVAEANGIAGIRIG